MATTDELLTDLLATANEQLRWFKASVLPGVRSTVESSLNTTQLRRAYEMCDGTKTSKDIAAMLNLGLQTVRTYRKTLMKKIGVTNIAGLTQVALSAGLTGWGKQDSNLR